MTEECPTCRCQYPTGTLCPNMCPNTPHDADPRSPKQSDMVNSPSHYNSGNIEVITAIDDWNLGFSLGNTVKYIARADHKGKPLEDLEKAMWYLKHEIEKRKK